MGLDVYVGSLTRYYSGDWLTIVQQKFPGQVTVIRPEPAGQEKAATHDIQAAIKVWQEALTSAIGATFSWNESHEAPYFTDKPAWDGYGALVLWAAYEENQTPPEERLETVTTENWLLDKALLASRERGADSRFPQLLLGPEMWLPIEGQVLFHAPTLTGKQRLIGSCEGLLADLESLNAATWGARDLEQQGWAQSAIDHGSPLDEAAKFGWAMFHRLATLAVQHRLPMVMDY